MGQTAEAQAVAQALSEETHVLAIALRYVHRMIVRIPVEPRLSRSSRVAYMRESTDLSKQLRTVLESRPDLGETLRRDPELRKEIWNGPQSEEAWKREDRARRAL